MKYFIACGELSGDKIVAKVAAKLLTNPGAQIKSVGGPHLHAIGAENVIHIEALQLMGWLDVILNLPRIQRVLEQTKKQILKFNPDSIILVDNASFNLRLAKWCKKKEYKVVYLIPPKVWASRPQRINQLKTNTDLVLSLFPFEQKYLEMKGVKAEYYGHPLVEELVNLSLNEHFRKENRLDERPIISILPGSRPQEVKLILPHMVEAACRLSSTHNICVSLAPSINISLLYEGIPQHLTGLINIVTDPSVELLRHSELSLVTSGTATLEAAILGIPHICCYRMHPLNYQIAIRLITAPYISLPNLILMKALIPEFIQKECSSSKLEKAILLLRSPAQRSLQIKGFYEIRSMLKGHNAISSLARAISAIR